jgi:hypothetical protein
MTNRLAQDTTCANRCNEFPVTGQELGKQGHPPFLMGLCFVGMLASSSPGLG